MLVGSEFALDQRIYLSITASQSHEGLVFELLRVDAQYVIADFTTVNSRSYDFVMAFKPLKDWRHFKILPTSLR